ncbi:hypothetical protein V5799_028654 [Amblyomma americanum]|uniref:G-protein coupled receptors family 1 profile domain-containing protein n=1 Tax=Amblyomma americanum TaxID=6943 RepID=A0AAQ4DC88_AMBAM
MDPAGMADMQVQQESTSRSRICTIIAVMACIVMGCFLLLGFSLKRNDELVAILDQYREYLNQQSVQNPTVASAAPQAAKEPVQVKRPVPRANNTRADEVQVVYLNAPSATPTMTRRRGMSNTTSTGRATPGIVKSSNAARVQEQQLANDSAYLVPDNSSATATELLVAEKTYSRGENVSEPPVPVGRVGGVTKNETWNSENNETANSTTRTQQATSQTTEQQVTSQTTEQQPTSQTTEQQFTSQTTEQQFTSQTTEQQPTSQTTEQQATSSSSSVSTERSSMAKSEGTELAGAETTTARDESEEDSASSDTEEELDGTLITDSSRKDSKSLILAKSDVPLSNMVVLIVATFFAAWTPYAVLCLWAVFGNVASVPHLVAVLPPLFCKTASAINPFIYFFSNPRIRADIYALLTCRCRSMGRSSCSIEEDYC